MVLFEVLRWYWKSVEATRAKLISTCKADIIQNQIDPAFHALDLILVYTPSIWNCVLLNKPPPPFLFSVWENAGNALRSQICFPSVQGKKATAFPAMCNKLSDPSEIENRVVVDGNLITSRGPGTTMEFALGIVEKLFGRDKALELAKPMLFTHP